MVVLECVTQQEKEAFIKAVESRDFRKITKRRFFFDWKALEGICQLYKLVLAENDEILGLMGLHEHPQEKRIEIQLLAVSRENMGAGKVFDNIAGCLIGFACRKALRHYETEACISLSPKTGIKEHYMKTYGMIDAGRQVYLEREEMDEILEKYPI